MIDVNMHYSSQLAKFFFLSINTYLYIFIIREENNFQNGLCRKKMITNKDDNRECFNEIIIQKCNKNSCSGQKVVSCDGKYW